VPVYAKARLTFLLESLPSIGSFRRMPLPSRLSATVLSVLFILFAGPVNGQQTPNFITPEEEAEGWKLLFDGMKLTGFRGLEKPDFMLAGWKIVDGALVLAKTIDQSGKVTGGSLATVQQYGNFEFSFEWKLSVSGSSGVLYGAHAGFGMKPYGYQFQLIDDMHHPDGLKGGPIRRTGALYGILPPGENKKINSDGWNTGRILVQDSHVEHWVNNEKVLTYEYGSPRLSQAVSAAVRTGVLRVGPGFGMKTVGPIILLDKGEEVSFRSLKIRVPGAAAVSPGSTPATPTAPAAGIPATPDSPATPRVGPTPFKSRIPIPGT